MALELFKPFIYAKLELYGMATTIKAAKRMVEKDRPEVWDILEEVIREHPVLLNRAPTLHRLGVQAFEPILVEGKAIRLHPLVCTAFNADFDGDQMAVHVPLSIESQLEARVLMMSTNNILSPANGKPIIVPSQDIILGLYFMTMERENEKGEGMIFADKSEVLMALNTNEISLHAKIKARMNYPSDDGKHEVKLVNTTPGRVKLSEILPENSSVNFDVLNQLMTKKQVTNVIDYIYRHCGQKDTVIFADKMMSLGFNQACSSGISFGISDLTTPIKKNGMVKDADDKVKEFEQQYLDGLITKREKYNKVIDLWTNVSDNLADEMMTEISTDKPGKTVNSVWMMAHSGARGSQAQIKQLAGMRGLMAKPSGDIIETPIISSFKEGLNVLEYFNSTHGARKGLADTALKTANSGYLTRRLVDVAQDCIITIDDCETQNSITMRAVIEGGDVIETIGERILGRTAAEDVTDEISKAKLCQKGEIIDEELVDLIEKSSLDQILVRSPLLCEAKVGICSKCYGRDLARGTPVNIGEAVGVIAAQSIGEPGTQLTMRTFHIGGAAQSKAEQSSIEASINGKVRLEAASTVKASDGNNVILSRSAELFLTDEKGKDRARYRLQYGAKLYIDDGDTVDAGQKLVEWDPYTSPIITEAGGIANYMDLIDGISMTESTEESGFVSNVVQDWKSQPGGANLRPRITLRDEKGEVVVLENGVEARSFLSPGAILSVENGQKVSAGDVLARIPRDTLKTRDITGGLPRVAELFEARIPKDAAIIAEEEGYIEFSTDYKSKRKIKIVPSDKNKEAVDLLIPKGKMLTVQEGDYVRKGDMLLDGNPVPHDILRILGLEKLAEYLIKEVQDVYRLQGVKIDDKHIETVVRQMLQKSEITEVGDSTYLVGEQVYTKDLLEYNKDLISKGLKPAEATPLLLGITKASLQTKSFISAASFQETTRVLTEAAVSGKQDNLDGLKENVIVGRLIPAGTGSVMNKLRKLAFENDKQIKIEREQAIKDNIENLELEGSPKE